MKTQKITKNTYGKFNLLFLPIKHSQPMKEMKENEGKKTLFGQNYADWIYTYRFLAMQRMVMGNEG